MKEFSKVQKEVMKWLCQGWSAFRYGGAVHINGRRVCSMNTISALEKKGLVKNDSKGSMQYVATEEGRTTFRVLLGIESIEG